MAKKGRHWRPFNLKADLPRDGATQILLLPDSTLLFPVGIGRQFGVQDAHIVFPDLAIIARLVLKLPYPCLVSDRNFLLLLATEVKQKDSQKYRIHFLP